MKTFKNLLFLLLFAFTFNISAQTSAKPQYKIVGNEIVKIKTAKSKQQPKKTKLIHKIKGKIFAVWKSRRGAYFIYRTSKKTQKKYKKYLKF